VTISHQTPLCHAERSEASFCGALRSRWDVSLALNM